MPADLRVQQLVVDPQEPEAMAGFFLKVECANVGDEGTGPFVVRFELDQTESIELPVQTVAAGESEWVSWGIDDGLRAGDHFVYCVLDAEHAVPEPEERRNERSVYFKVADIEFAPQQARGEADYDEYALATAVIGKISDRVNLWFTLAVQAVDEWEKAAKARVAEYNDADATVDPAPVFAALGEAMVKYLPGMSTALGIMDDATNVVGLARAYMGAEYMGLAGARARLEKAIEELQIATGSAIRQSIDGYEGRLNARLTPENGNSPLHEIEYGSTEPGYVAELADWLGVPEPTEANTTEPIKQEMMEGFERVMEDVNRQLWKEAGV